MAVGKRIENLAKEKKISLRKIALNAGISYNTLYAIVKRDSNRIDLETLEKIAKALSVNIMDLKYDGPETSGKRIRAARKERGVQQEGLAKVIGVNPSAILKYENDTASLTWTTVFKIAEALDIDPYYLIDNDQILDEIFKYLRNGENKLPELFDGDKTKAEKRRKQLNVNFMKLNEIGQEKAVERVEELAMIPDYQKNNSSKE